MKLNLGCGPLPLDGWTNIDRELYPGVDLQLDVTSGLPFENVSCIYAEHFIEHLPYPAAQQLLSECRRVLRSDGILRLSTPNLDWVWASHYKRELNEEEALQACFGLNRAFRGWGHQFLYNERTLRATLLDAGFSAIARVEYGQSVHPGLADLERHEWQEDFDGFSHILIVEASGSGGTAPPFYDEWRTMYLRDLGVT